MNKAAKSNTSFSHKMKVHKKLKPEYMLTRLYKKLSLLKKVLSIQKKEKHCPSQTNTFPYR